MIIRIKRRTLEHGIVGAATLFIIISTLIGVSFTTNYVIGANVTNNTILARVNVTNTEPNVTLVVVDDDTPSPSGQIDLIANGVTVVTCNATIFDFNGANDINSSSVNASLYIQSAGGIGDSDNNFRYVNQSCGRCTADPSSSTNVSCDCRFALQYYANDSSTWLCNVSVRDVGGTANANKIQLNASGVSSTVTINKLLAINTSSLLDYGNLSVTETSTEVIHNVTNAGNINLNLSLRGYGGTNNGENFPSGRNLTMICDFGNISVGNQRYAVGSDYIGSTTFDTMRNLTNATTAFNFTFPARTDDTNFGGDRNSTLWRLRVPLSVGGICNGTIIFGAIDAEV